MTPFTDATTTAGTTQIGQMNRFNSSASKTETGRDFMAEQSGVKKQMPLYTIGETKTSPVAKLS